MKAILLMFLLIISIKGFSQENAVTLSGGYSFANAEDSNIKATGWRINGTYEFNPLGGKFSHGISVGYISLSGSETTNLVTTTNRITSVPIFYAPKYLFGSEKFQGFIKGALGMQFASFKREAIISFSDRDSGFYGGAGVGFRIFFSEDIFLSAEYEIAWASNRYYSDGWLNSAMGGIGIKF